MRDYILAATSVLAVVVTALFGLLANRQKFREDLQAKYDASLHQQRTEVYLSLWRSLEVVARYAAPHAVTRDHLSDLSTRLREWFFRIGGLYLSDDARQAYLRLQGCLVEHLRDHSLTDKPLDHNQLKPIYDHASALRAELSRDIGSRKNARLKR